MVLGGSAKAISVLAPSVSISGGVIVCAALRLPACELEGLGKEGLLLPGLIIGQCSGLGGGITSIVIGVIGILQGEVELGWGGW